MMPLVPPDRADLVGFPLVAPVEDLDAPFAPVVFDRFDAALDLVDPPEPDLPEDRLVVEGLVESEDLLDAVVELLPVDPPLVAFPLLDDGFAAVVFLEVVLPAVELPLFDAVVFEPRADEEDPDFGAPLPADFPADFADFAFEPVEARDPTAFSLSELFFVLRAV